MTKTLILGLTTLFLGFVLGSITWAQHEVVDNKLISDRCHEMRSLFAEMLVAYNAVGGMIVSNRTNCTGVATFRERTRESNSLEERLNLLVQAVPSYRWSKRDGVVNLQPQGIEVMLLDTNLRRFVYNSNSTLDSVIHSLEDTPEVRSAMAGLKLRSGPYFGGLQSPPSKKAGIEVVILDGSVREILNDVVRRRERGLWIYSEWLDDQSHRFTLQFVIK